MATAIDPSTGLPYDFGDNTGQWTTASGNMAPAGYGANINALLASIGYTPSTLGLGGGQAVDTGNNTGGGGGQMLPENPNADGQTLTQYLAAKGLNLKTKYGAGDQQLTQAFDASGNPVGSPITGGEDDDPGSIFLMAMLAAGGFGGAAALGAGAAGAGAGEAGGGLSSADTAALYGNEGYGAGSESIGGSMAGANGGIMGSTQAGNLSTIGQYAADNPGAFGGTSGGMSSSDLASLYGSSGYGSAASPAELAAGGSGSSWLSNLGLDQNALAKSGVSLAGGLAQSLVSANTASKALGAQTNATNAANALQASQYAQTRADWAPYRAAGTQALGNMTNLLNNPSSVLQDPGVAFQQQQGQQALDRSAAAAGGVYSGAQMKAGAQYNQNFASTALDRALARYGNVAQIGATGTQSTQAAGTNYANTVGSNTTALGNAGAASDLYTGNAINNAISTGVGTYNTANGLNPYGTLPPNYYNGSQYQTPKGP